MSDKPILFSAPMVRALLAGTKTQTRRVLTSEVHYTELLASETMEDLELRGWSSFEDAEGNAFMARPRFNWRDRLWVKETWQAASSDAGPVVGYRADLDRWQPPFTGPSEGAGPTFDYDAFPTKQWAKGYWMADVEAHGPWATPLHMPRWASRLTLHVTDVRVQRLHDISEEDALAEGMTQATADATMSPDERAVYASTHILCPEARGRILYQHIWDQINGTANVPAPWSLNPWVVATTFQVECCNITQARAA